MHLSPSEFNDVQSLVRYAHAGLENARFHLLRIRNVAAARRWLTAIEVTTAQPNRQIKTAVQVAFTHEGLRRMGVEESVLDQFSHEFRTGMHETHRSRRLGDVAQNRPSNWSWGYGKNHPHLMVLLYATSAGLETLDRLERDGDWRKAFGKPLQTLQTADVDPREPFGFIDGTSQPAIDWAREPAKAVGKAVRYSNKSALGEFLLGYRNEYDRYTQRPLVNGTHPHANLLPLAEDVPGKRDFGRNGTFLVFRDLEQRVEAFQQFVEDRGKATDQKSAQMGTAMVGRIHPDLPLQPDIDINIANDNPDIVLPKGATRVPLQNLPMDGVGPDMRDIWLNQFHYGTDLDGIACPHGAHVRRANPRTSDMPEGTRGWISRAFRTLGFDRRHTHEDLVSSTRFHRLLRRGRKFGPIEQSKGPNEADPGSARGLYFICLNANISRQFEFVQASWIENAKFDGLDHSDPLLGSRKSGFDGKPTDGFRVPGKDGIAQHHSKLPSFVTVRGGAYFFLPGVRALRFIAAG